MYPGLSIAAELFNCVMAEAVQPWMDDINKMDDALIGVSPVDGSLVDTATTLFVDDIGEKTPSMAGSRVRSVSPAR